MDGRDKYLKEHMGYDKILDRYVDCRYTEYVVKYGGDVFVYRVYGTNGDYKCTAR